MKTHAVVGAVSLLVATACAEAWEFRTRFVERIGITDVVLPGNVIDTSDGAPRDIRVQFGVFDDGAGPAPLGGFIGWNDGTITVTANTPGGSPGNSVERLMPNRIGPYNFAPAAGGANGNPPGPQGTPFTMIDQIDATVGNQSPIWNCSQGPVPPPPVIRGRNQFVSVFTFRINPDPGATQYTITVGGTLNAAGGPQNPSGWVYAIDPYPPDCGDPGDPFDDEPGQVVYLPYPVETRTFFKPEDGLLNVIVAPPEGSSTLRLIPDAACYNAMATTMEVRVEKEASGIAAVGGQFLLAYDTRVLEYVGGVAGTGDPGDTFSVSLIPAPDQEPVPGHINFAVGVADSGPGTTDPAVMATLTFRVVHDHLGNPLADACDAPVLVCFRADEPPMHTLVFDGDGLNVLGSTYPLPAITIDSTPPSPPVVVPVKGSTFGTVRADAGTCSAVEGWTASSSDSCDPAVTLSSSIAGSPVSSPHTFKPGLTTVTVTATDGCGNTSTSTFDVNVLELNQVAVSVRLAGVSDGTYSRCITFDIPGSGDDCPADEVSETLVFTDGVAQIVIDVPCGMSTCLSARDRLHTLRRTADEISIMGRVYVADFTGDDALPGGNLNDDEVIDILDFGGFVGQLGASYGTPSTSCSTFPIHADFSGNGVTFSEDFTFITANFLEVREEDCCGNQSRQPPRRRISMIELVEEGWSDMLVADLNRDGWVDEEDIVAFVQGARPCRADINRDGEVSSQDFFLAVSDFFAGSFDYDQSGTTTSTDFFVFLAAFLAPC